MTNITIYTTGPGCGRCNLLKAAFQKAQIAYEEKPLDAATIADVLCETGILVQSAPLVRDGVVYFFQDDFFDSSGNLIANWWQVLEGIKLPKKEFSGMGGNASEKKQECAAIWGKPDGI